MDTETDQNIKIGSQSLQKPPTQYQSTRVDTKYQDTSISGGVP